MKELTFEQLVEKIKEKEPFSFSRFGDGEWNAIFKKEGGNCDGHEYYPDLGDELSAIVRSQQKYYMGMQPMATRIQGDRISEFTELHKLNLDWVNADILHKASIKGKIYDFFDVLKGTPVVMAAPIYLKTINKYFDYNEFVEIPEKNCWLQRNRLSYELSKICNRYKNKNEHAVVLIIASMAANVLVDELYKQYGDLITFIDTGSVLDPYVGIKTRTYHNDLNIV